MVEYPKQYFDVDIECNNCGRHAERRNVRIPLESSRAIRCKECNAVQGINLNSDMEIGDAVTWGRKWISAGGVYNITIEITRVK